MAEHTGKRWYIRDTEVIDGEGHIIAYCGHDRALSASEKRANALLVVATPVAYEILDEIREALEQTNGRETSQVTRNELAPALARIRRYFELVKGGA